MLTLRCHRRLSVQPVSSLSLLKLLLYFISLLLVDFARANVARGRGTLATLHVMHAFCRGQFQVTNVATPSRPPTAKTAKRGKVEIIKENSDYLRHPLMQVRPPQQQLSAAGPLPQCLCAGARALAHCSAVGPCCSAAAGPESFFGAF